MDYFSGLGSFYVVGKPSDERECRDKWHFSLKLGKYGTKGGIFDHRGILIFSFILLLYPIKG